MHSVADLRHVGGAVNDKIQFFMSYTVVHNKQKTIYKIHHEIII